MPILTNQIKPKIIILIIKSKMQNEHFILTNFPVNLSRCKGTSLSANLQMPKQVTKVLDI